MSKKYLMLRVLKECNWSCPYCEYSVNKGVPDEGLAISIFNKNKDKATHITGGEPGLLSTVFWDNVFKTGSYGVLTNGLFITRGYYEKYRDRLTNLYVHATPELDTAIHPEVLRVLKSGDPVVEASVVVHKHNVNLIKKFLEKYPDIDFKITLSGSQFDDLGYNICDKATALKVVDQLKGIEKYASLVTKIIRSIMSDKWNLCFISDNPIDCSECENKCYREL